MEKAYWRNKQWLQGSLGFYFDSMDVGILSFAMTAIALDWGLNSATTGLLGSINSLGMAIGALLAGMFADRYGRRLIFIATILLFSLGSIASAFATGIIMLFVLRFLIGLGLGGELPIASTYVSETAPPKTRGRAVVMAESFWALGWITAAIIGYFIIPDFGWRAAFIIAGVPAIFALYVRRSLPESPKYNKEVSQKVSIKKLFSKDLRKGTISLAVLWFVINFAYYGMFLWLPSILFAEYGSLNKSFLYTLLMTFAQIPGYMLAAWLIEKIGRKWVISIFLLGTAISAFGFGWSHELWITLTFGAFLNFFNLGAWGALYAYTPEVFPTALRARGTGFAGSIGRIGSIIAPYMVGLIASTQISFTIFFAMLIIGLITIVAFGPETKGKIVD